MMFMLFFMCGFLAALNDILIPHLKPIFDLNYAEVMLIQFSFFSAFLLFAVPSGKLIDMLGYQRTMSIGLLAMGSGALLFIPAANLPSFPVFMCALVVLAGGITSVQVSGNPYVAMLGPASTGSSRLLLIQASNSVGATIAPYFGGVLILNEQAKSVEQLRQLPANALHAYRLHEAAYVKGPYIGIALALIGLAIAIAIYPMPALHLKTRSADAKDNVGRSIWRHRHLVLGAIGIFLAVGGEVAVGSFLVNYFTQPDIGGLTAKAAATYVSIYWAGAMVGRFLGSAVMRRTSPATVIGVAALIVVGLLATSIASSGHLAMWSMMLVGLFNSIMFPGIFTLGIAKLGPLTSKGSGILMSAAVGGAIIPVLQGAVADRTGLHRAFIVSVLCYLYVAFYGFKGSKPVSPGLNC